MVGGKAGESKIKQHVIAIIDANVNYIFNYFIP